MNSTQSVANSQAGSDKSPGTPDPSQQVATNNQGLPSIEDDSESPLCKEILHATMPYKFTPPYITLYDGKIGSPPHSLALGKGSVRTSAMSPGPKDS
ncbi:hypothetical protein CRG98_043884 [Punica granatum]|uniref:Uncharacterized protein n=1 Tax=Punica granatum TaxID=22663 RepID=A0A2I0HWT6_PUNGR|nr:hypothetical protein CRG98_043884 [Punica granatum]